MIRWILIILGVIVLMFLIVFAYQRFTGPNDEQVAEGTNLPIVVSDSVSGTEGQPITGDVLANDTDADGTTLVVNTTPISNPTNGTLQLNPDGTFTYTPNAGYVGTDSFRYEACDPDGNCAQGTVQITINSAANSSEEGANNGGQGGVEETPSEEGAEVVEGSTESPETEGETNTSTEESTDMTSESSGESTESTDNTNTSSGTTDSTDNTNTDSNNESSSGSADNSQENTDSNNETDQNQGQGGNGDTHVVKQGEWLIQIGRCYGVDPVAIRNDNQLMYPGWLMADEELVINNVGSVSEPFFEPCVMFYTVEEGDTLYSIAQTYQVELDMLMKANFGCYGYGYYYYPPVPTPYEEGDEGDDAETQPASEHDGWYMHPYYGYGPGYGAHSPYVYTGCYFPSHANPIIHVGQELIIPVNLDNAGMRP